MTQKILRIREVQELTGLSRPTIFRLRKAGQFPSAVQLGTRAVGWKSGDIEGWIANRPLSGNPAAA